MDNEALLKLYLEKLHIYTLDKLQEQDVTVLEALKASLIFLEGEMNGY